jgi:glycosyltransferase involved in cell wall biosynthesis
MVEKDITIIIPAYNEKKRIGDTLSEYLTYYIKLNVSFEIFVILNGCRDGTEQVVNDYIQRYPRFIKKEVHIAPIGKGGALIEGLIKGKGKVIAYTDADGATPPQELYKLIQVVQQKQAELTIGSRWVKGAKVFPKQPFRRRVASRCFNLLVRSLFGLPFKDTQCPAKALSRELLLKISNDLHLADMSFDINLIVSALKKGAKVKEIPIYWQDKEGSKVKLLRTSLMMFMSVVRLRLLYSPFHFLIPILQPFVEPIRKKLSGWPTSDYRKIKYIIKNNENFNI